MEFLAVLFVGLLASVYTAPPYAFTTKNTDINVLEGEDAEIVCAIESKPPALPMIWINQTFIFGQNEFLWEDNGRVKLVKTQQGNTEIFTLTLYNLGLMDEGLYECQVPGSFKLRQMNNVFVNIPPEITSDPDAPSDFDLKIGDNQILECPATGKPDPVVTWRRIDNRPIQGEDTVTGQQLFLNNVTEFENGEYICIASNGFGQDQTRAFDVNVEFEPKVQTPSSMVHTGPGLSVRLECTFSGNPSVQTIWQYKGVDINTNQYSVRMRADKVEDQMNTWLSTVVIDNIQEEQLGEYTCIGRNTLGEARESVTLSAMPHSLQITSDSQGSYSDQYTLQWRFSSKPKPIECFLVLSQLNQTEDGVRFVPLGNATVPASVNQRSDVHPQEYIVTGLEENMTYTANLQCRNEHGSINLTEDFEFETSEDVNLAPPPPPPAEEEDLDSILSTLPRNRDTTEEPEPAVVDDENDKDSIEDNEIGQVKYEEPKSGESKGKGSTLKPAIALLMSTSMVFLMC